MNTGRTGGHGRKTELKSKDVHATTPATDHGHAGPPACVQVRGARQNNLKNLIYGLFDGFRYYAILLFLHVLLNFILLSCIL